ncbi:hypothetical protein ABJI51_16780 [Amycolatopsis sp. NEAU-NG30]|uniref:Lipoprotein n=1 Tax=Amycolatopsis melonis TaxID=3156488 RepID=A0ABV0LEL9_9PSEU
MVDKIRQAALGGLALAAAACSRSVPRGPRPSWSAPSSPTVALGGAIAALGEAFHDRRYLRGALLVGLDLAAAHILRARL